jgi:hypothetical protein
MPDATRRASREKYVCRTQLRGSAGSVTIDGNARLGQVTLSLDRRLGPLHVGSNPALTNVTVGSRPGGFVLLDRVTIAANAQLAQVSVDAEMIASITIEDNPALADTSVTAFFITGDLTMRDRGTKKAIWPLI